MKTNLFPPPVTGVHEWIYGCAVHLRRSGLDQSSALSQLAAHVAASSFRDGRTVIAREIADAIDSAFRGSLPPVRSAGGNAFVPAPPTDYSETTGWPAEMAKPRDKLNPARLARVLAASNIELVDLWERSPVRPPDNPAPAWVLGSLFAPDDLLCIGASSSKFNAKSLRDWTDTELLTGQLIVPNPLRKATGRTKKETNSAHCRDATGPRRYIIVESDKNLTHDQQARVLEHLSHTGRLAVVVMSGGKSLHGRFRCDGVAIATIHTWFRYAVTLGADPRLWLPEQFVRLPDGRRDNGKRQTILFLNPSA